MAAITSRWSGGTRPSTDRELNTPTSLQSSPVQTSPALPDVEAGRDQRGLGQVVQTEVQLGPVDGEVGEGPDDEAGLEDEAARHAAQHDAGLGKARHEVEETRPPAEDGDEDDDAGGDPGHVLQLPVAVVVQWDQVTVVLQEQHAGMAVTQSLQSQ